MNGNVESNFVLELAFFPEQSESCSKLLSLSGPGAISLVVPAHSLAGPYETLIRRRKQRHQFKHDLDKELNQIARTEIYTERLRGFDALSDLLIRSADDTERRLEGVLADIIRVAENTPLETRILADSLGYQRTNGFSRQDAIVHASIISDLKRRTPSTPICFSNRSSKDFADQNVVDELRAHQGRPLLRFDDGLSFVLNRSA